MKKDLHRSEGPAILKMILLVTDGTNGEPDTAAVVVARVDTAGIEVHAPRVERAARIEGRRPVVAGGTRIDRTG